MMTEREGSFPRTESHEVDYRYMREHLEAIFKTARQEDVEEGGIYDARSSAINIWTHHWQDPESKKRSETMGTFYFHWGDENRLWKIEVDKGSTLQDLLRELAILEEKALDKKIYGKAPT